MSYISTVRAGRIAAGLVALGSLTLATALAGTPRQTGSPQSTAKLKPTELATSSSVTRKVVQRSPIPYSTLRKPAFQLRSGTSRTLRSGVNGVKEVVYLVSVRPDGTELKREIVSSRVLKQPRPELIEDGRTAQLASRGYFSGRRVVTMNATWYDPYDDGSNDHGRTFTGVLAGYGVVAVDPRFMPLGTRLYIEGYGYAVAADTGGAIKGSRIDLAIDSQHDVKNVKDMKHVRVHILD